MERTTVQTDQAPAAIGPYSQAVRAGPFVYTAGQIGLDPGTGQMVAGDVTAEAHQVFANLRAVLVAAGSSLDQVVKTTLFLADMADFAAVNAVFSEHFTVAPPARSTVAVAALPRGARLQLEAVALVTG